MRIHIIGFAKVLHRVAQPSPKIFVLPTHPPSTAIASNARSTHVLQLKVCTRHICVDKDTEIGDFGLIAVVVVSINKNQKRKESLEQASHRQQGRK